MCEIPFSIIEAAVRRAYEMGASDYVNRPFDSKVVYRRVYNTIKLYAKQRRLVSLVSDQIRKQEKNTSMLVGELQEALRKDRPSDPGGKQK